MTVLRRRKDTVKSSQSGTSRSHETSFELFYQVCLLIDTRRDFHLIWLDLLYWIFSLWQAFTDLTYGLCIAIKSFFSSSCAEFDCSGYHRACWQFHQLQNVKSLKNIPCCKVSHSVEVVIIPFMPYLLEWATQALIGFKIFETQRSLETRRLLLALNLKIERLPVPSLWMFYICLILK